MGIDYSFGMLLVFILGYGCIVFEHPLRVNKAAIALVTGVLCWMLLLRFDLREPEEKLGLLAHHLADITQVLFFLIGAMTIVELITSHRGFDYFAKLLAFPSPRKLFWVLIWLGFGLSSVLDNLTTLLVLVSLLRQAVPDAELRKRLAAGLVFAVNAGGAWTPIGDVTTTMLWIDGRVNGGPIMATLFLPCTLSLITFGWLYAYQIPKGEVNIAPPSSVQGVAGTKRVLWLGVLGLVLVPVVKMALDIPPFMSMMGVLGVLWALTDRIHGREEESKELRVEHILTKIDISCVLFFFGVLLGVDALQTGQVLQRAADLSQHYLPNIYLFSMTLGLLSSVVDNVPLVAGIIKLYDLSLYPADHLFWNLIAYCAGVGGSLLIVGSAPGVALMSLKHIGFLWYLIRVSGVALVAYVVGWGAIAAVHLLPQLFYATT